MTAYNDTHADAMLATLEADPERWDVYAAMADRLEEIGHEDARAYRWCAKYRYGPRSLNIRTKLFSWPVFGEPSEEIFENMPQGSNGLHSFKYTMHRLTVGLKNKRVEKNKRPEAIRITTPGLIKDGES